MRQSIYSLLCMVCAYIQGLDCFASLALAKHTLALANHALALANHALALEKRALVNGEAYARNDL